MQKIRAKQFQSAGKIQIKLFSVTVHRTIFQEVFGHKIFMVGRAWHSKNSKIGFTSFGAMMHFLKLFKDLKMSTTKMHPQIF